VDIVGTAKMAAVTIEGLAAPAGKPVEVPVP
jgi:hypothetical protein